MLTTAQKIDRFSADSDLAHAVVHGTPAETVQTDNGPIPTLARAVTSLAAFNVRGAWAANTQYAMKDVYTSNGFVYLVMTAHVSSTVDADVAAGKVALYQGVPQTEFTSRISRIVRSVAELEALPSSGYSTVFTLGYFGAGSRGSRMYYADPDDKTTPADRGLVFQASDGGRFKLVHDGVVTPYDFGAKGNGAVGVVQGDDDTVALQQMLAAWSPSVSVDWLTAAVFNFSAQLSKVGVNLTMKTAGAIGTVLNWIGGTGAADNDAAADLIVFGNGADDCRGWNVGGLGVESAVKRAKGAAVHAKRFMDGNDFAEFRCGSATKNGNLFHGVWMDLVNVCNLPGMYATKLQGAGLRINGSSTDDSGSDLFLSSGNISFCAIGIHQGGGFGGLRTGQMNCFGNGINYLFDTTIVPRRNREVFYEAGSVCDGATSVGMVFDDPLTAGAPVTLSGFIGSSGQIGSGAGPYHGVWVKHWPGGRFNVNSGQIFNHLGDAIRVDDASVVMSIASETHIFNNGGFGINATVLTTGIYCDARYMAENVAGNFSANVQNAAWDSFNTAVTSSSGAIAQLGSVNLFYRIASGVCHFTANISITTNGGGASSVQFTLPRPAAGFGTVYGKDLKTGKALTGIVAAGSTEQLTFFDSTYPGSDGAVLVVSGSYQYK
ncbi:hypothetical protein [Burkholderia gladioli]|uniref:hypothetical protein n=1 Tax=Burkholderia gladioli TaxID=28095 RepID=UPI00163E01CA|nr:hypothetical protein [Burkholderia gladioli]